MKPTTRGEGSYVPSSRIFFDFPTATLFLRSHDLENGVSRWRQRNIRFGLTPKKRREFNQLRERDALRVLLLKQDKRDLY